jgi:acetoin utilization deacetylase AcuC-like enzyme
MLAPLVFDPLYKTDLSSFGFQRPFALDRGELVLAKLREQWPDLNVHRPTPLTDADILTVHSQGYLRSLRLSSTWLDLFELKPEEFDQTRATRELPEILHDFKLKSGGTKLAVDLALKCGLAANLGGGYHHAFPDRGRGYCAINDIAIAIRAALKNQRARKVLIVDLDFHQGDGTAIIFQKNPDVFTLSVHSSQGWPEEQQQSDFRERGAPVPRENCRSNRQCFEDFFTGFGAIHRRERSLRERRTAGKQIYTTVARTNNKARCIRDR